LIVVVCKELLEVVIGGWYSVDEIFENLGKLVEELFRLMLKLKTRLLTAERLSWSSISVNSLSCFCASVSSAALADSAAARRSSAN